MGQSVRRHIVKLKAGADIQRSNRIRVIARELTCFGGALREFPSGILGGGVDPHSVQARHYPHPAVRTLHDAFKPHLVDLFERD